MTNLNLFLWIALVTAKVQILEKVHLSTVILSQ